MQKESDVTEERILRDPSKTRQNPPKPMEWQIHPVFARLKEHIISRIPTVTPEDAEERIHGIVESLCGREIDAPRLAEDYGLSLQRLDVPKKFQLAPLYRTTVRQEAGVGPIVPEDYMWGILPEDYRGPTTFSFCLGLMRAEGDPKSGEVQDVWRYMDDPEYCMPPVHEQNKDATCYAKYHIIFPEKGEPFLFINPIQTPFLKSGVHEVESELEEKIDQAGDDKEKIRELDYRISMLYSARTTAFRHRDRNLLMALAGLEIARSLGIRRIALPSQDMFKKGDELELPDEWKGNWEYGERCRFPWRYDQARDFLKQASEFELTEWRM